MGKEKGLKIGRHKCFRFSGFTSESAFTWGALVFGILGSSFTLRTKDPTGQKDNTSNPNNNSKTDHP